MKRSIIIVIGLCLLVFSGCAHTGGRHLNIWPLAYYNEDTASGEKTVSLITPIIYYHRSKDGATQFSLRPLFSIAEDKAADTEVIDILYPLIKYKKRGIDEKFRIFPLFKDEAVDVFPDKVRTAHDYFPLYWGTSEDGQPYGGLFPLYGTVKKRFGKDDIFFLMWPAYSRTVEDSMTSHSLLWPVFKATTGEGGWGFRVFPLWGHEEMTGKSYKTFFLFPFVTFRGRYLDTDSPMIDTVIIPFYVDRKTPHSRSTSYLWPFFTVSTNAETNFRKIDAPWPFVSLAKSDTLSLTQVAPFYRNRVLTEKGTIDESMYILYPIYKEGSFTSKDKTEQSYRIMLIDKYITTTYANGTDDLWIYLFPLYDRRKLVSGEDSTVMFYPLPLYDDGFKQNYLPLFEVYRKDSDPKQGTVTRILHHLYIKEVRDGVETIDAPFYYRQQKQE